MTDKITNRSADDLVSDTMNHAQLHALGEHHKAAAGRPAGSKHHGAPVSAPCTCPSGLGGLQWPCPAHPPEVARPAAANAVHLDRDKEVARIAAYWTDQARRGCVDALECALREMWNTARPAAAGAGGLS